MSNERPADFNKDPHEGERDVPHVAPKKDGPIDRIRRALGDTPGENSVVQVGDDAAGNPVYGTRTPWATVLAADVLAVADAIPKESRTPSIQGLRNGCGNIAAVLKRSGRPLPPTFEVFQEAGALAELVRVYDELAVAEIDSAGK